MQCKHPEQEIWWDSEEGGKKWNNGQGAQLNDLKQSYNFRLLRFTLVRSSATTTTTQDLSYSLAYRRWPVEPRQHEDKQESLLELCFKGRGIQDPEVPR